MALGQIPLAAPIVDQPELALDLGQRVGVAERSRGLVAGQRRAILADQRL
jgi:hypothetical protein